MQVVTLKNELHAQLQQLPIALRNLEISLSIDQAKYENLLRLKPIIEQKKALESTLPGKEKNLQMLQKQLSDCRIETKAIELRITEPSLRLDRINIIMPDVKLLEEVMREVLSLQANINNLLVI